MRRLSSFALFEKLGIDESLSALSFSGCRASRATPR